VTITKISLDVTISDGNYVGGAVTNSQVGVTTARPPDAKQKTEMRPFGATLVLMLSPRRRTRNSSVTARRPIAPQ
jgi:hypothetical protein